MKYPYFKSQTGNFGDDLNPWLWPQFFGEEDDKNDLNFLGIGSILFNENPMLKELSRSKKIIFGTGVRPSKNYVKLNLDETFDIKFFRGPLSVMSQNENHQYITDAAYALRQLNNIDEYLKCKKKYEISIMPYFRSVNYLDWESICKQLGVHYISPFSENGVDFTLSEIAASKVMITEAMHGAIIADIMRVPWHRYVLTTPFNEGPMVSEFKWMDWLFSISVGSVNASHINFYQKSLYDKVIYKATAGLIKSESLNKSKITDSLVLKLSEIDEFHLSSDSVIRTIDEKMGKEIYDLQQNLSLGVQSDR